MLRQRIRQLIESGVPRENILYLDLADDRLYWLRHENPDLILDAWFELHPQKRGSETVHCFFDEVQTLPHWQLFINRLMRSEKCEVTVAGSLLPSPEEEAASPLTGREVDLVALLPSVPGQERAVMLVQVCAFLADPRVKQSEVRSLSEAMVELAVAEGTIVTWHTDETIPVGFGTIRVVPIWRFLLDLPQS